jgi:DNA-binding SARP family transcriptional activator
LSTAQEARGAVPVLTARLLGRFSVVLGDHVVDTASSRRTRSVLAYLLAHRRAPVPRDMLAEALWPNADADAARNSLHVALTGVRRALRAAWPGEVLRRHHDVYTLDESVPLWVDVVEFERSCRDGRRAELTGDATGAVRCYEVADHLYEGDFLAGETHLEWAAPMREALRVQAIEVRCRLMSLYVERDDFTPAASLGRRVLGADPCNEVVHRNLMICYARSSLIHLALAQYHRCAEELWHEFRVRPSPGTTELYEKLRRPVYS